MDGQTDAADCFTFLANVVSKIVSHTRLYGNTVRVLLRHKLNIVNQESIYVREISEKLT